jgi:hypothetical protein
MSRISLNGITAPVGYFLLTQEHHREICNGAGPHGGGWLVPDTAYGLSITEPANVHDFMYHTCEGKRKSADDLFLSNMQSVINNKGGRLRKPRLLRAKTYYYACRLLGRFLWKDKVL